MQRTIAAIALVAVLLVGGGIVATAAYQIGVSTAVTTAVTETGATVVTPVAPAFGYPGYGYGYGPGWGGPGFSIIGFLGTLFFIFLIFALIRAAFFRGGGRRSWGGPGGWGGPGSPGYDRWQGRAREVFDDFHRDAHKPDAGTDATKPPSS